MPVDGKVTDTTTGENATYPGILESVTAASYTGYTTNVGYVAGTGTSAAPNSEGRTDDVVNFNWNGFNGSASNPIMPGQETPLLVIETDASYYTLGTMGASDGVAGGSVAYGPAAAPEPVSMSLLGGGLAFVGLVRWRRKTAK